MSSPTARRSCGSRTSSWPTAKRCSSTAADFSAALPRSRVTRENTARIAIAGVVVITRPEVTGQIVHDCHDTGIRRVWIQVDAEADRKLTDLTRLTAGTSRTSSSLPR
ncbi:MAG: hypothetical protein DMF88_04370 [Acidobacteria bacterium]|nr:MAG: hypothetical protein DMF88_04370 [Acidobacteriota bacterium]